MLEEMSPGYEEHKTVMPEKFSDYFSHFYWAKNHSDEPIRKTLLPTFQTMLIFCFDGQIRLIGKEETLPLQKCIVVGPVKQPLCYELDPGVRMLVVNFQLDGFYRFFGSALATQNNPDEYFTGNCFDDVWTKLNSISDWETQCQELLVFVGEYFRSRESTAAKLSEFQKMETPVNPIKAVASELHKSERMVQMEHKKYFGYSAKEMARFQRFLKAYKLLHDEISKNTKKIEWFSIIEQCGYYDQSQLIHDFKHYVNITPTQYLNYQNEICNGRNSV
jgi:AraC-like DNA-binding protein